MSDDSEVRRSILLYLESLHDAGVTHLYSKEPFSIDDLNSRPATSPISLRQPGQSAEPGEIPAGRPESAALPAPSSTVATAPPTDFDNKSEYPSLISPSERTAALTVLAGEVAACVRCSELAKCRKQTVFGVGNPEPRLVFVGEAPGADEDRAGEPFVGAAGQLLDRILKACKLDRNEVYILNVLKCRPPQNRTPLDEEVANCWGYAHRQLEILQPEFICCLGAVAARAVLQQRNPLGKLRGTFHRYRTSRVVVTYHPAYLLRSPDAKKLAWDDMKMLMAEMGRPV